MSSKTDRRLEILYDGYYYDVTKWVKKHPGGGVINFYTEDGEDATIAIKQFHLRSEKRVMSIMKGLSRRPAGNDDKNLKLAPTTVATNKVLTEDYMKLHNELFEEGLFTPSIFRVSLRILEVLTYFVVGTYLLWTQTNIYLRILGTFCLALYGSRGGMLGHEAGHGSLTGNPKFDYCIQNALLGLCMGLCGSYWSSQHNRHHAMPQRMKHDVDLETLPLVAFNKKVVRNNKNVGKSFFIRNQAYLFVTIDTFLVSILFRYYSHPKYALYKGLYGQLLMMALHSFFFINYFGLGWYMMGTWWASIHLLGTFAMSHTHLPVSSEPGVHWVQYGLEHTMNVDPSNWADWAMGYLNYQIEHHLFPTIPNFRLHKVTARVKALAAKHNIPYHCASYTKAIMMNFKNLSQVARELN